MVETHGELNAAKSNAVLVCHALSGHHHVAGYYKDAPDPSRSEGWWENLIGPGRPLDTRKFFVIGLNNLGGCHGSTGPGTINPATGQPFGSDFPVVTVPDWVEAQRLRRSFRDRFFRRDSRWIAGRHAGAAMVHPASRPCAQRARHRSGAEASAENIGFNEVARQAIRTDPDFSRRSFLRARRGAAARAAAVAHARAISLSVGRLDGREVWPSAQGEDSPVRLRCRIRSGELPALSGRQVRGLFDANTYLLMTKALDYFDPAKDFGGDLTAAFANSTAKFFIAAFTSDWRFSPARSKEIVRSLLANRHDVSYAEIESVEGQPPPLMPIRNITLLRATFEGIAYERRRTFAPDFDVVLPTGAKGAPVLDLGCGDGELLARLVRRAQRARATASRSPMPVYWRRCSAGSTSLQADIEADSICSATLRSMWSSLSKRFAGHAPYRALVSEVLRVGKERYRHLAQLRSLVGARWCSASVVACRCQKRHARISGTTRRTCTSPPFAISTSSAPKKIRLNVALEPAGGR